MGRELNLSDTPSN